MAVVVDMTDDEWALKVEQFLSPLPSNVHAAGVLVPSATGIAVVTLAVAIVIQLLALVSTFLCLPAAVALLLVVRRVWPLVDRSPG